MRRRVVPRFSLFALLAAVPLLAAPGGTARVPVDARLGAALARIDSLSRSGNMNAAIGAATSALGDARARGDRSGTARLLSARATLLVYSGRPAPAEASAREAVALAVAARDSALEMRALRWLAVAIEQQGRLSEAMKFYERSLALAIRLRDAEHEGWGRVALGYSALTAGRLDDARAEYERAIASFRAAHSRPGELWALNGLGLVHQRSGDFVRARECYERILGEGRAANNGASIADALGNLGTIEFARGAPEAAMALFREADLVHRARGNVHGRANSARSIAVCMTHLGQFTDAAALLDSTIALCRERALKSDEAALLEQLAAVRRLQRRLPEAARLYEESMRILRPLGGMGYLEAAIGRARVSGEMDSAGPALAWLDREIAAPGAPAAAMLPPRAEWCRADLLLRLGRPEAALAALLRGDARAQAQGIRRGRMGPLVRAAEIERRLGHRDRAGALLARATALWEDERGLTRDPEWREEAAEDARRLYAALAEQVLGGPDSIPPEHRARMAFDALQRFKARTLQERMSGPGREAASSGPAGAITVRELQARVLGDGELLLDAFLGHEATFLFAVTRDSCRAVRLAIGDSLLAPRLRLYHDLLATRPRSEGAEDSRRALEESRRALSALLFGPVSDLTRSARRIVLAPDGWMNIVPAAGFDLRGAGAAAPALRDAGAEVVQVPSATVLAGLRARAPARDPATASPTLLALVGAPRPRERELRGARAEAEWLARRYHAEIRVAGAGPPSAGSSDLERYDVLHVAAHTRVDDQHPWRSGIVLRSASRAEDDSCLTAAEVARLRLPASLVVLSACESGGGQLVSGEGVIGLTGAFIAAGSPAVLASLWPVSDRATTRLMQAFYRSLERGRSAAAALNEAQASLARDPRTEHPFYWAGFVLVGDGDVGIRLRRQGANPWMVAGAWILAAAALVLSLVRTRRPATRAPLP